MDELCERLTTPWDSEDARLYGPICRLRRGLRLGWAWGWFRARRAC